MIEAQDERCSGPGGDGLSLLIRPEGMTEGSLRRRDELEEESGEGILSIVPKQKMNRAHSYTVSNPTLTAPWI